MKKRNSLKVQPLRRYKKPIYPSHADKNPIDHPETMPYPFSHKAVNALVAAGILVGIPFLSSDAMPSQSEHGFVPKMEQDSLVNPFPFESLGVPFVPPSYGTGLPSRLGSAEAREVIDKVFLEEGLKLSKNYKYKEGDVEVMLSGYDPDCDIGYVWVDYTNMGKGMTKSWSGASSTDYYLKSSRNLKRYEASNNDQLIQRIESRLKYEERLKDKDFYLGRLELIKNISTEAAQKYTLKELRLDIEIESLTNQKNSSAKEYFKKHIKEENFEHKEAVVKEWLLQETIERYAKGISRLELKNTKQQIKKIIQFGNELLGVQEEEVKKEQFNLLITFLNLERSIKYSQQKEIYEEKYKTVFQWNQKDEFLDAATELMKELESEKLSLEEAEQLKELETDEKDFIAPIGQRDRRFSYSGYGSMSLEDNEKLNELRETLSPKEYRKVSLEMRNAAMDKVRLNALKQLEDQVRQYIQWAKQQGGH